MGGGEVIEGHTHDWHQLVYVAGGAVLVSTGAGSWVAPPNRAIWVPAGIRHALRFIGSCALRTLYIRPGWRSGLSDRCGVIAVGALLRELIIRIAALGMLDERDAGEAALAQIVIDEFRRADIPPFELPEPSSAAMRRITNLIRKQSAPCLTAEALASAGGMGVRTLQRRFAAETGMSPGRWQMHHGLLLALEELAGGAPVKVAAARAGYASASAFVAAFRGAFGVTPARYFART